jgi:hypothetical protein
MDSEAWRRYAALEPARLAQIKQMAESAPTEYHRRRIRRRLLVQRLVPSAFDRNMAIVTNPIVETLLTRFKSQIERDPRMILFGSTKESDVVAMQSSFDDESSLVIASDGLDLDQCTMESMGARRERRHCRCQ